MIQDKASDAKLQQDIASCTTADQLTDLLMAQLIEPVETEIESASSVHQAALETATREAKEIVIKRLSTVDTHSTQATMDIERAEQKCTDSLEYVGMQLMRIQKAKDRVAMLTQAIDKIYDQEDKDDTQLYDDNNTKPWRILSDRKKQVTEQLRDYQAEIFAYFDKNLGGIKAKHERQPLTIPRDLTKCTSREIIDAFKIYLIHRASEYYIILPFIVRILEGYDTNTGLYFKPPTLSTGYNEDTKECNITITIDNKEETIDLSNDYKQQAEVLYRSIQAVIGVAETSKMQSSFPCGLHNNQSARCAENDGPMLIYCLLAKYGKENTYTKQQIEQTLNTASEHFKTARPTTRVDFLRPYLTDALRLRIPLQASQTVIPIHDILAIRFPWMAAEISQYKDGGSSPEDCAATLDSMFKDIEKITHRMEQSTNAAQLWQHQTIRANYTNSRYQGKGDRKGKGGRRGKGDRKGKGKGKSNGKGHNSLWHETNITAATKRALQATHDDKYNKYNKVKTGKRCAAKGCTEKSGSFTFCLTCYKKGMEQGHIICYDGYKQDMSEKNRRSLKTNKDQKNLRVAAAFGEQMYEMLQQEPTQTQSENIIQAHQITYDDDDAPEAKRSKTNIHERILAAKQAMKQQSTQDSQDKFNTAYQAMTLLNSQ